VKADGELPPREPLAPLALRDGRVFLEDVALDELAPQLEGRPARLISQAAVREVLADGPRCLGLGALEDPDLLKLAADAGWWARVRSRHELALAIALGFPGERLVAAGPVVDDGFLKEALLAGVAALDLGERERDNAARIARLLALEAPDAGRALPPAVTDSAFASAGVFFAAVLGEPPDLALDMAWPLGLESFADADDVANAQPHHTPRADAPLSLLAVRPPAQLVEPQHVSVRFLSRDTGLPRPRSAHLHGSVRRGDWIALPNAAAVQRAWIDPVHEPVQGVLVHERSWRLLPPRGIPPRDVD